MGEKIFEEIAESAENSSRAGAVCSAAGHIYLEVILQQSLLRAICRLFEQSKNPPNFMNWTDPKTGTSATAILV